MKNIIYHQINITNKKSEIEYLKNLENESFFLLGVEVTDSELSSFFHLIIDPQHDPTNKSSSITSVEYSFNYQDNLYQIMNVFDKICMVTIKPDMDSIGAMSILTLLLTNQFHLDGDMVLRLKAIAKSDRHGRTNWKNRRDDYFHFENYNAQGLPAGLAYMTSDHKIDTEQKVKNMIQYFQTGEFPTLPKYNETVMKNLKKSSKSTSIQIIVPKRLSIVCSNYRGAVAYGYKHTSTVIAKNPNFVFGIGNTKIIGKKVTIAQYEDNKYIDLVGLCSRLNELELGWGGSSVIIGSPQDRPCSLDDNVIIEESKKFLL